MTSGKVLFNLDVLDECGYRISAKGFGDTLPRFLIRVANGKVNDLVAVELALVLSANDRQNNRPVLDLHGQYRKISR